MTYYYGVSEQEERWQREKERFVRRCRERRRTAEERYWDRVEREAELAEEHSFRMGHS